MLYIAIACLIIATFASKLVEGELPKDFKSLVDNKWVFDGESSDLVQQYFDLHRRGVTAQSPIVEESLPEEVKWRLEDYGVKFKELPGLAVRALLWDSGYILDRYDNLIQVKVWCGFNMTQIAQNSTDVLTSKNSNCGVTTCTGTKMTHKRLSNGCIPNDAMFKVNCMISGDFGQGENMKSAMWANGGDRDLVPSPHIVPHIWNEEDSLRENILGIHCIEMTKEMTPLDICPSSELSPNGQMVIPCVANNPNFNLSFPYSDEGKFCAPRNGVLMNAWLKNNPVVPDLATNDGMPSDDLTKIEMNEILSQNDKWVFDGESSDLVQQYLSLYRRGVEISAVELKGSLPKEVQNRLDVYNLQFAGLPPLMQRALLWDTGYVFDSSDNLQKVQVLCPNGRTNLTMGDIQMTSEEYYSLKNQSCSAFPCEGDTRSFDRANVCYTSVITQLTKCVIESSITQDADAAMWGNGGDKDMVPDPHYRVHFWEDKGERGFYYQTMHSIHMAKTEVRWKDCPKKDGSMIIPCEPIHQLYNASSTRDYCSPLAGKAMNAWLNAHPIEADLKSDLPIMPILGGIAIGILIIAAIAYWLCKKKHDAEKHDIQKNLTESLNPTESHTMATLNASHESSKNRDSRNLLNSKDMLEKFTEILESLERDEVLISKRVILQDIIILQHLAKGAYGDVYLCHYSNATCAVKCLHKNKRKVKDVADFVAEIQLTARLDHPNIIKMIGASWSSVEDMCMLLEYCPKGELYDFLQDRGDMISWAQEKLRMAAGIAKALAYLHSKEPGIIHRDLKTRNVLLTENMNVKLIDFGVSRAQIDETMTAGVGTPYWTAPEVLDSQRYSEKSDIYSFGIFLSELDTCEIPYHDVRTDTGEKMTPLRILQKVMAGELTPSFTPNCPPRIVSLARQCVSINPDNRPSASDIVEILTGTRKSNLLRESMSYISSDRYGSSRLGNSVGPIVSTNSSLDDNMSQGYDTFIDETNTIHL